MIINHQGLKYCFNNTISPPPPHKKYFSIQLKPDSDNGYFGIQRRTYLRLCRGEFQKIEDVGWGGGYFWGSVGAYFPFIKFTGQDGRFVISGEKKWSWYDMCAYLKLFIPI